MPSWRVRHCVPPVAPSLPADFRSTHGELNRTALIEFESVEAALAAHESPGYQEAMAALRDGAVRDLRIVPGVD